MLDNFIQGLTQSLNEHYFNGGELVVATMIFIALVVVMVMGFYFNYKLTKGRDYWLRCYESRTRDYESLTYYIEQSAMYKGWKPDKDIAKRNSNIRLAVDHLSSYSETKMIKEYQRIAKEKEDQLNEIIREKRQEHDDLLEMKDAEINQLKSMNDKQLERINEIESIEHEDLSEPLSNEQKKNEHLEKKVRQLQSGRDDLSNSVRNLKAQVKLLHEYEDKQKKRYKDKTAKLRAMIRGEIPYELVGRRIKELSEDSPKKTTKKKKVVRRGSKKKVTKKKSRGRTKKDL